MVAMVDSAGRLRLSENSVSSVALRSDEHGCIALPAGLSLTEFTRAGDDLLVSCADGAQVLVRDYFARANPPELVFSDGVQLSRDVVAQLAGTTGVSAPASVEDRAVWFDDPGRRPFSDPDSRSIGNVDEISGRAWAVRSGTRLQLRHGDPVLPGDVLETGPDGALCVKLADQTAFSMTENGRIVLGDFVRDPATRAGKVALSVVEGVLSVANQLTVVPSFELPPAPTPTLTTEEVTAILREYNASLGDSD